MGLDLVELVMGVEDAFGIAIPDEDAARLETPRALINYLENRLVLTDDAGGCLSQRAFYRLRSELTHQLAIPRSAVRPSTRWNEIIPRQVRPRVWERLGRGLQVTNWPPLAPPLPLFLTLIGATVTFMVIVSQGLPFSPFSSAVVVIPSGIGFAWLAAGATRGIRTSIPGHLTTVGQTASFLALHAPAAIRRPERAWTRAEITATVVRLVQHHLGIERFDLDDEFVRDLGAG